MIPAEAVAVVAAGIRGAAEMGGGPGDWGAAPSQQLEPLNELASIGITYDDFAMDVNDRFPLSSRS